MHSQFRFMGRGLLLGAVLLTPSACKDQQKCDEALRTARKAMQTEFLDMKLARQWREHAGKLCGTGQELNVLDEEILKKESDLHKEAVAKAEAEKEAGQAAIDKAKSIWARFDKLDKKERDAAQLKKARKRADKLAKGLAGEYAKQVTGYNAGQFKKRAKRLKN